MVRGYVDLKDHITHRRSQQLLQHRIRRGHLQQLVLVIHVDIWGLQAEHYGSLMTGQLLANNPEGSTNRNMSFLHRTIVPQTSSCIAMAWELISKFQLHLHMQRPILLSQRSATCRVLFYHSRAIPVAVPTPKAGTIGLVILLTRVFGSSSSAMSSCGLLT
jgi:hypothetical protein